MQTEYFRQLLQKEYQERCARNESYSLRAYARDLGLHAACLSVLLKGKRPITEQMLKRISKKISMSEQDLKKIKTQTHSPEFEALNYDVFAVISLWYHDAILELAQLKNFKPDINWIAKVLEITPSEVQYAVERLVRCEMLTIKKSKWTVAKTMTTLHATDYTTAAMKHLQKKILKMSEEALDRYDLSERYHSSLTLAFNKKDIKKAKEMLRKFKEEFTITMQKKKSSLNEVYQLNVGFFPMTNINQKAVLKNRGETE